MQENEDQILYEALIDLIFNLYVKVRPPILTNDTTKDFQYHLCKKKKIINSLTAIRNLPAKLT